MIVELHNKLGNPQRIEATRIVIRAENGDALAVAVQPGPGQHFIVHRGDGDEQMQRALQTLGINETVISDVQDMPKPPGTLWTPGS
jgi:hypothetical protein